MKKYFLFFFLLLFSAQPLFAQQKEWENLLGLLQKEAAYFQGKSGFIQLLKSEYNTFSIEKFSVSPSRFVSRIRLRDRFGNEETELYLEETVLLESDLIIKSANLFYNYSYYFEDFPKTQYLLLEFEDGIQMLYHISATYKNLKTGKKNRTEMEDKTNQLLIPIRAKNRNSILKAIDRYQKKALGPQLELDRSH